MRALAQILGTNTEFPALNMRARRGGGRLVSAAMERAATFAPKCADAQASAGTVSREGRKPTGPAHSVLAEPLHMLSLGDARGVRWTVLPLQVPLHAAHVPAVELTVQAGRTRQIAETGSCPTGGGAPARDSSASFDTHQGKSGRTRGAWAAKRSERRRGPSGDGALRRGAHGSSSINCGHEGHVRVVPETLIWRRRRGRPVDTHMNKNAAPQDTRHGCHTLASASSRRNVTPSRRWWTQGQPRARWRGNAQAVQGCAGGDAHRRLPRLRDRRSTAP
jgi:hypothetical protein